LVFIDALLAQKPLNINRVYAVVDGLMNILESGCKNKKAIPSLDGKPPPANAPPPIFTVKLKDSDQLHDLLKTLVSYLNSHLSYGVFYGVIGANLEVIMRLDIGLQLSGLVLGLELSTGGNALEAFIKSEVS
jgi:hypothetical protein